ncbi:serine/threonine protein kinase [Planomonospora corallina]|uniref:Serine/threonine protein kinase n=1 Tax=Planomonospora corallina TaxID=1806052 RepID=A0ABV8IES9_9ACTN
MLPLLTGDPHEIGPYRVVGRLGAGGMGVVYAGVDATGRRVAVKLVHEALSLDLEFRRRFSREIRVLGGVESPCVARVLGSDPGTERPWLATEFIAGLTLEQHAQAEGPLTGDALYGLAAGLAEALVAMHAAEIVHRDLKPSNAILAAGGPKLIDFGIAKVLDGSTVTHTGTLIGSPGWISPEEYGDGPAGTPADVYGWALLVLFAVTGEQPYGTGRPEVLAYRIREETPESGAVPEGLRGLVERALAKDPAERPLAEEVLAGVTEAWWALSENRPEGRPAAEAADVTALIQHTWVLPRHETPDWPVPPTGPTSLAGPVPLVLPGWTPATGPVPPPAGTPATGPVPVWPVPGTGPVPAGPVPPAGKPGPSWVHAYIATAVGLTLVAITTIVAVAVTSSAERSAPVAQPQAVSAATDAAAATAPVPASTSAPSPSVPSPAPTKSAKPKKKTPKSAAVSLEGIRMALPKSWRMIRVDDHTACIESPDSDGFSGPWRLACRPDSMTVVLRSGPDQWPGYSIEDEDYGFMMGQDMPCLAGGNVASDPTGRTNIGSWAGEYGRYVGVDPYRSRLNHSGLARMGDSRKAFYRDWRVMCADDVGYTMRIWHLPESRVSFYVLCVLPEDAAGYKKIIASTDLTGYPYAAPI